MAENLVNDTDGGSDQVEAERMVDEGCQNTGPFFWETSKFAKSDPEDGNPAQPSVAEDPSDD